MTDNAPSAPAVGEARRGWLAARKETDAYLTDNEGAPYITREWMQKLADLLGAEHAAQEHYTKLLDGGGVGTFPESRR